MYVQTTLKKSKTGSSPVEKGAKAGVYEMKVADIVDGSEPIASLTMNKEQRTELRKRSKQWILYIPFST